MYLIYMGLMILLALCGYDIVDGYEYQAFFGVLLSVVAGVVRIWRSLSS